MSSSDQHDSRLERMGWDFTPLMSFSSSIRGEWLKGHLIFLITLFVALAVFIFLLAAVTQFLVMCFPTWKFYTDCCVLGIFTLFFLLGCRFCLLGYIAFWHGRQRYVCFLGGVLFVVGFCAWDPAEGVVADAVYRLLPLQAYLFVRNYWHYLRHVDFLLFFSDITIPFYLINLTLLIVAKFFDLIKYSGRLLFFDPIKYCCRLPARSFRLLCDV